MSVTKLIVVIGATGTQGGSVVRTILKEPGWRVRGVTRDASSLASKNLQTQGVEMVSANLDDTQSLINAFEGATAIFGVTDFWAPFVNPEYRERLKPGQTMNEWVYEYEKQQGTNIVDAAFATKGLERLVFSSLSDARKWSDGKYKQVWHFDSKAHAVRDGIERYPDFFRSKVSCIQVGYYLTNWLQHPIFMPRKVSGHDHECGKSMGNRLTNAHGNIG
jgi:NAD(P)-dependent dehydrogenase (short-subunit alcohol dehydrogenase family)